MFQEKEIEIRNKFGIHARVAAQIVEVANKFASNIVIAKDNIEADAKSILEILMVAATRGEKVTVRADGADSDQALAALTSLFESGFGEPM